MMEKISVSASQRYFANAECAYFPCHKGADPNGFNCLFCFCPLYAFHNCGGSPRWTQNGVKDCTDCLFPHIPEHYDEIIKFLSETARLSAQTNAPSQDVSIPSIDVKTLLARLDNNTSFVHQLLGVFVEDGPKKVKALSLAISQNDMAQAARLVHSLKGTAMTIEALPLLECAKDMESRIKQADSISDSQVTELLKIAKQTFGDAVYARMNLA